MFSSVYSIKSVSFSFKFLITQHSWANLINKKQHTATSVLLHITLKKSITTSIACFGHTRWTWTLYHVYCCTWHIKNDHILNWLLWTQKLKLHTARIGRSIYAKIVSRIASTLEGNGCTWRPALAKSPGTDQSWIDPLRHYLRWGSFVRHPLDFFGSR
jgi:hypothetical protein